MTSMLIGALAFAVGTRIRSPWDDAIENARTPEVTAYVAEQSVSLPVPEIAGTVHLGTLVPVLPPPTLERPVVTGVVTGAGQTLLPGAVLAEVSGRPLIAWALPYPMYRDLLPGTEGDDVAALQEALISAGVYAGPVDGAFGRNTARAVTAFYDARGLDAPPVSTELTLAVEAATESLDDAQRALRTAEAAVLAGAGDASSLEEAREAVSDAGRALDDAVLAASVPLPAAEVLTVPPQGVVVQETAPIGAVLDGGQAVATIRTGTATVTGRAAVDQVPDFAIGTTVHAVALADSSLSADLVVAAVSDFQPGTEGQTPGRDLTLTFAGEVVLPDMAEVRLVPGMIDETVHGLTVPLVAVRRDTSGTYVTAVMGGDQRRRVPVDVVITVDGTAVVDAPELEEGDEILVAGP